MWASYRPLFIYFWFTQLVESNSSIWQLCWHGQIKVSHHRYARLHALTYKHTCLHPSRLSLSLIKPLSAKTNTHKTTFSPSDGLRKWVGTNGNNLCVFVCLIHSLTGHYSLRFTLFVMISMFVWWSEHNSCFLLVLSWSECNKSSLHAHIMMLDITVFTSKSKEWYTKLYMAKWKWSIARCVF